MFKNENISFELVICSADQIEILYSLLKRRKHKISHTKMPVFAEHKKFVESNPYRYWYIVRYSSNLVGSFYLKWDNSIGLNLIKPEKFIVKTILDYVVDSFEPMPRIPSITPDFFHVNIADQNINLIDVMEDLGTKRLQVSFKL